MAIQFFYFDLGNVILKFDHEIACRQMAEVSGISADDVRRIVFDSDLQTRYECGEVTSEEVYDYFCQESRKLRADDSEDPDFETLQRAGSAIFELNLPVVRIVQQLHEQKKRLGILSNTCTSHWEYVLSEYPLVEKLFGLFVLSHEVKAMKPAEKIYRDAIEMADCAAKDLFFVDDREENVAGAIRSGLDAVQFTSPQRLAEDLHKRGVVLAGE